MVLRWPVEPMRAVPAPELPSSTPASTIVFEPKWDGFRAIIWVGKEGVRIQSRNLRDLSSYFPEICREAADFLAPGVVLDGEIVIWDEQSGRTSFNLLQRRLSAGRRVGEEAARHPAHLVAFDMLRGARGKELLLLPLAGRRRRLQRLLGAAPPTLTLCPQTSNRATALSWLTDWQPAGVEGLVSKSPAGQYVPGQAVWQKTKAKHTEEYIIGGVTGSLDRPISLLLGRYDQRGILRVVGRTHRIRAAMRTELSGLRPPVFRGDSHPWPCPLPAGWLADFNSREPVPYRQVEPTLVAEVLVDHAADGPFQRLRHAAALQRIRADLRPSDLVLCGDEWGAA
ncbi:ATP-dependent DNA ligase [Nucisporomicrobium flavum]|uniref:ATP-dependent DNA ligase n=1 Tax=Nucisporomicrobium flavum TaxID=2785915 RepID=UPI0018F4343E|nr:ATP-dependent DNA ligase [Nucisporomicrobium flavum]